MTLLFLDFETRSPVSLSAGGLDRYMTAAEATVCTYALDDAPVRCWDCLAEPKQPSDFTAAVYDPQTILVAHNAAFDRAVLTRLLMLPTPVERWWCTRAQAYAAGLPGGLEALCSILRLPSDQAKLLDGKRLIQLFCVPHDGRFTGPEEAPDDWRRFKEYAVRDTEALRAVYRRLPTHNFRGDNLRYFWLDQSINERGFAVDLPLVSAAADMLAKAKQSADSEVARLTSSAVTAVTQRNRLLAHFKFAGLEVAGLTRAELETALQDDSTPSALRPLIELRLESAKASGAKCKKALAQEVEGRLRYTMQMGGAGRTGRTAHKGFQPGNMPLPRTFNPLAADRSLQHPIISAEVIDELVLPSIRSFGGGNRPGSLCGLVAGGPNTAAALALRHCIIAREGHELVVADFKNVESVVLAWLADDPAELAGFRSSFSGYGTDAYRELYAAFFGGSPAGVSTHQRQIAKVVKLACGFGGSVGAIVAMAVGYGIDLADHAAPILAAADDATKAKAASAWRRAFLAGEDYQLTPDTYIAMHCLVQRYRATTPAITEFRRQLGRAAEGAVIEGRTSPVGRLVVGAVPGALVIDLPSGYRLYYWAPHIGRERFIDPETGELDERTFLAFMRPRGGKMVPERSWPGLLVENAVQATANHLLRHASLVIETAWPGEQVLSVHDEIVCESPEGAHTVEELCALMCTQPPWAPGLPLGASGWKGPRYGKR